MKFDIRSNQTFILLLNENDSNRLCMNLLWCKFSSILTSNIALNCSKHNRLIRLLYYLPIKMGATEGFMKYQIEQLEEKNKKLRDYVDNLDSENDNQAIEIEELKKENKNLNKKIDKLILKIDQLEEENENLRKDLFHLTNNGKAK